MWAAAKRPTARGQGAREDPMPAPLSSGKRLVRREHASRPRPRPCPHSRPRPRLMPTSLEGEHVAFTIEQLGQLFIELACEALRFLIELLKVAAGFDFATANVLEIVVAEAREARARRHR
mmetsp:Transcript_9746/g.25163  ORF Transcript_9746/g.25163 Transcript_9746/m.25163 type:complete len:120 (-) Transcript_9746:413-772(-)